jgi:hypothetical protein
LAPPSSTTTGVVTVKADQRSPPPGDTTHAHTASHGCGAQRADGGARVPDECGVVPQWNADDTGVSGAGGLISITATTVTVSGTLHANGGGEVQLQACTLTLEPSGQVLATGLGGFTLFQASGPMEIDGTLVAESTNTLDYLDPAHLPVVNSVSISPDADIVETILPCPRCAPGR